MNIFYANQTSEVTDFGWRSKSNVVRYMKLFGAKQGIRKFQVFSTEARDRSDDLGGEHDPSIGELKIPAGLHLVKVRSNHLYFNELELVGADTREKCGFSNGGN